MSTFLNTIIVHLEDPEGSGRAACNGAKFQNPDPDEQPYKARELCPGCQVRTQQMTRRN